MIKHQLIVEQENAKLRLDVYLTQTLTDLPSRTFIQRVIEEGNVLVNGQKEKARYKIAGGDEIKVEYSDDMIPDKELKPEKIKLNIFYEDDAIVLINKAFARVPV